MTGSARGSSEPCAPAVSGTGLRVIDAQDVPENFVHVIARDDCRNVIFIDAVTSEGPPGTVVFGPLAGFDEAESYSTHKLALSFSGKFLESAGKKVFLLGVVPADLAFGAGLTAEVERAAASLRDLIRRAASAVLVLTPAGPALDTSSGRAARRRQEESADVR